jgi:hypothetical protein
MTTERKLEQPAPITESTYVEAESYTVMSLCDDLSLASEDLLWSDGSCCACPSYTTVPCSC